MALALSDRERQWAAGADARAMALRIVADAGRLLGADRLIPITSAHIDGCLYHGDSGVHFAERLVAKCGRVAVPATLNVGALDLLHPELVQAPAATQAMARRLMQAHVDLGCAPSWTCAPYQAGHRPACGEQIAWGESNAVVFANSVLGARTNRYGDFLDIAAALAGRAPHYGLHRTENRRATVLVDVTALSPAVRASDAFYPVFGAWLGRAVGGDVAVVDGIPADVDEDRLKALGAGAASTGAVGLVHIAGVTPEAPTVDVACQGQPPDEVIRLSATDLAAARRGLDTGGGDLDCVALGSPHFSFAETEALHRLLAGRRSAVPIYVCTGRGVMAQLTAAGIEAELRQAGVQFIVDTCVVVTPILKGHGGVMMTNSAKFAHYGPSNTGYHTCFGSLDDCVASAVSGRITRDETLWQ